MPFCPQCGGSIAEGGRFCPACGAAAPRSTQDRTVVEDPYLGKVLDKKFRIDRLLGVGGMGKVYEAIQLSLDKRVCVKVLRNTLMQDESLVGRFEREARAATRLNHPNSITVIDFGQDPTDGSLYMVMEFIPGKDLAKIIVEERPLSEERIVNLMDQVVSALADAHEAGVVHRDLKPENIMVTDLRGTKDFVKVLDFGIAKINEPEVYQAGLTQAGMVCGTPEYMSPEQARGEELDARSDIYALGVILWQMVVGRIPFEAPTAMGIVTKHLTEPVTPPSSIEGIDVSPEMEAVILKAMSKDREGRQPTALALQQELNTVLNRKQAYAQRGTLGQDLFDGAEPSAEARSVSAPAGGPAPRSPTVARPEAKAPSGAGKWIAIVVVLLLLAGGGVFLWLQGQKDKGDKAGDDAGTGVVTPPVLAGTDAGSGPAQKPDASVDPKTPEAGDTAVSEAANLFYLAGREHVGKQDWQKAIEAFEKAIKTSPRFAKAHKSLAMCFQQLGDNNKAKQSYRRYLEVWPEAPDRESIQALIQMLK